MKAVIIYASVHHGNTKKVLDAIAKNYEVELVDATKTKEKDLTAYDLIGFASGIYVSKYHQSVINFAACNLPQEKRVFYLCTYGGKAVYRSIDEVIQRKSAVVVGKYSCKGFDTFGPFKLVGGIAKGHPNEKEIAGAVDFYAEISKSE